MILDEHSSKNQNQSNNNIIQNIILENREKLSITGVNDVLSFDDQIIIVDTELGMLTIKGNDLKINKLSIDTGEIVVDGTVNNLNYSERQDKKASSLIGRIFK